MWQWIAQYWAEWAFGLLGTAVIAVVIKYKALLDGVLAILHDRIYQACQYYIKQGSIDTGGLKNLEYLYKSYHALGGNGTGTELYNRAKALPIKQEDGPMMNRKIPAATIARTVVLALALVNQLLSAAGKPVLPIDSASVEQWVTAGLTTAAAIWAWWENNSFTPEAIRADELLDQMQGKIK